MNQFQESLAIIRACTAGVPSAGISGIQPLVLENAFRALHLIKPHVQVRMSLTLLIAHLDRRRAPGQELSVQNVLMREVDDGAAHANLLDLRQVIAHSLEEAWGWCDVYKNATFDLLCACGHYRNGNRILTVAYSVSAWEELINQLMALVFCADDPVAHSAFLQYSELLTRRSHEDEESLERLAQLSDICDKRGVSTSAPAIAVWCREWQSFASALTNVAPADLVVPPPELENVIQRWKVNGMQPGRQIDPSGNVSDW